MTQKELKQIALAIAKANKHSDAEYWAENVVHHFTNPDALPEPEQPLAE